MSRNRQRPASFALYDDEVDNISTPPNNLQLAIPHNDDDDAMETPATPAQGVGRRLNLESTELQAPLARRRPTAVPPPQFALFQQQRLQAHPATSMLQDTRSSSPQADLRYAPGAFPTPIMNMVNQRMLVEEEGDGYGYGEEEGAGNGYAGNYVTPMAHKMMAGAAAGVMLDELLDEQPEDAVDKDFILNLQQEGDLERLTRKAVLEAKTAWKKETMQVLRTHVDSLQDDIWLYK
ncbi:hypothetical protein GGI07_003145 [Coemansia sp. Benny D115]|nr:hypothetical protein GGI07_003145 [Coemansia sp. Benny D115]